MYKSYLIQVYHGYDKGKEYFLNFFADIAKTLEKKKMTFGIHYKKGQIFYSYSSDISTYTQVEPQFYSYFQDFQITQDSLDSWSFDEKYSIVGELQLENSRFFPFLYDNGTGNDFVFNLFRSFEYLDILKDKVGFFVEIEPIKQESISFFLKSKIDYSFFKIKLFFRFFRYIFNHKIKKDWKGIGQKYFEYKKNQDLFRVKLYFIVESESKQQSSDKMNALFQNFGIFKNYPLNQFQLKLHQKMGDIDVCNPGNLKIKNLILSPEELVSILNFPKNPQKESSLLKVGAKKLSLPIGVPIFEKTVIENGEIVSLQHPKDINIIGHSDYRSTQVPLGIYEQDRLRHMYVIGKTGSGKTKFLTGLMIDDIRQDRGIGVIDPHGDLIEEILAYIPPHRQQDVIIFDPTDTEFPFCFNPLDVKKNESKQVLAKGFIDIFKKFFGTNWNPRLEHVLRMTFLALLDVPGTTIFDIVKALSDKDFRYNMIEYINDEVVKNFWTHEFAAWNSQFSSEAIMPIINKIGQLLSIDMIKNIFSSRENKLDISEVMDEKKILLIKLPKGVLQEEVMGFLGAIFVTKIFQSTLARQSLSKDNRIPFFLYIDEFQNFATDTFSEILSEARKYGLGLTLAHQFLQQIPDTIKNAIFGNTGTLISFRVSTEDALILQRHFDPFVNSYDLSNLSQREFYCKLLVSGQVKDPFSVRSLYIPDPDISYAKIQLLYDISRSRYSRNKADEYVKQDKKQISIEEFREPIL